jgi:hypothetical protein
LQAAEGNAFDDAATHHQSEGNRYFPTVAGLPHEGL